MYIFSLDDEIMPFVCSLGVQFVTIHATTISRHAKAVTFHNTDCGKVVTGDVTIHVMPIVGPWPVIRYTSVF